MAPLYYKAGSAYKGSSHSGTAKNIAQKPSPFANVNKDLLDYYTRTPTTATTHGSTLAKAKDVSNENTKAKDISNENINEKEVNNSKTNQQQQSGTDLKSDTAMEVIEAVCSGVTKEILKQISDPENSDAATLAKTIVDGIIKQQKSVTPASKRKTCILSASSDAVEWSVQMKEQAAVSSNSKEEVRCETMERCIVTSPGSNTVYLTFYSKPNNNQSPNPALESKPMEHPSGPQVELDSYRSSATSFHQHYSFKDNSSITLTMVLMVVLYMYIFNFRR